MLVEGRHSKAKALNQMRLWLSGPRILNGLVRPGICLGREDFRPRSPIIKFLCQFAELLPAARLRIGNADIVQFNLA